MRTQHKQLGWHGALVALGLAIAAVGCKSTSENTPGNDGGPGSANSKDGSTSAAGSGGGGGKGGHGGGGAGSSGSSGNVDDGGGLPDGAVIVDGGVKLPDGHVVDPCEGPKSCWNCAATTNPQYLNHCTNSQCEPFDNKARLLGYDKNGKLPALP